ncbi:MAG TPA: TonB-dependent receptor, partial [Candidatus Limnocylindria bacterium]|nr:TonB-dependent receptor [Candidatus Limnocylindria bacterium]
FGFGTGPGGAINVVTLSATTRAEVRSARGAWDTWEGRASLSGSRGPLAGMFHAGYQSSRGDFFYPDDNGTPFNPGDDSLSRRLNNRFDGASAIAALTWRPRAQLQIGVREHLFQKAQGVPGLGAVPARHPRLVVQRSLTQVDLTRSASGRWPSVRLEGALTRERTRFRDREAELGLGRHETDDRVIGDGLGLEVEWPRLPARLALRFAADLRADQARLGDQADGYPDPPHSRRRTNAAAIGLEWRPVDQVVATAARRWERLSDHLRSTGVAGTTPQTDRDLEIQTPQLGLALRGPLGVEVRTNWNRAERAPDFLELFGNQGGVLGNPALGPERIESWDAGAAWTAPAAWPLTGAVEWAHFHSYARDLVLYVRSSQSSVRAQNITRARIHGDELSVRAAAPAGLSLAGALTWQTAVDAGTVPFWTGKRLPQRPGRESTVRLEWHRGPLRSSATLHELGDNYLDRYNRQRVTSRTLIGASLAVTPFLGGFGVVLEAKNLGNRQVSDVAGFPLPGRSLSVACEWRLGPPDPVHP